MNWRRLAAAALAFSLSLPLGNAAFAHPHEEATAEEKAKARAEAKAELEAEAEAKAKAEAEAKAAAEEDPGWTGSISAGVALQASATDTFGGNIQANATREWPKHRLAFEGRGNLAITKQKNDDNETKTRKNTNNQSLVGEYRYRFTDRLFAFNRHTFARDTIQRTRFAYLTNAGPGYRFWEDKSKPVKRHFDAQTGPGFLHQQFLRSDIKDEDVETRRDDARNRITWAASFEHANVVGDYLEILHTGSMILPLSQPNSFIVLSELAASAPIVWGWAIRNTFGFRWENDPASDADEATFIYTAGLEYKF